MVNFQGDSPRSVFREGIKAEIKALKKGKISVDEDKMNRMREALNAIANNKDTATIKSGEMDVQIGLVG